MSLCLINGLAPIANEGKKVLCFWESGAKVGWLSEKRRTRDRCILILEEMTYNE